MKTMTKLQLKTHFAVVLVALAFTHVTSTHPVSPRRGGQTTPRRIVKVGQQRTLPHAHCSVSGPCCVLLVLRAACATLCACCAHSSIGALPRLPAGRRLVSKVRRAFVQTGIHRNVRAAHALFCALNPVLCSWRFLSRAQRCVRKKISVPSPAARLLSTCLCPARLLLADDSFRRFEMPS